MRKDWYNTYWEKDDKKWLKYKEGYKRCQLEE